MKGLEVWATASGPRVGARLDDIDDLDDIDTDDLTEQLAYRITAHRADAC
ncbi:hypothetical protein NRF20_00425 [Streptomyces sp. R-74717]